MEPARVTLALAMLTCGPIGFKLTLRESKSIHMNVNRALNAMSVSFMGETTYIRIYLVL